MWTASAPSSPSSALRNGFPLPYCNLATLLWRFFFSLWNLCLRCCYQTKLSPFYFSHFEDKISTLSIRQTNICVSEILSESLRIAWCCSLSTPCAFTEEKRVCVCAFRCPCVSGCNVKAHWFFSLVSVLIYQFPKAGDRCLSETQFSEEQGFLQAASVRLAFY